MKMVRGLVTGVLLLILAACAGANRFSEIEALNEMQAVGSPFTQRLAAEYRDYANYETGAMFDHPDAIHFGRKGVAAASGIVVMPEPLADWNLLPEHMNELGTARGRLIVAFDMGAREIAPEQAAVAQARFDCWVEQQEENWQLDDIANCKSQFMEAIAALEGVLGDKQMPPVVAEPPPAEAAPMKPEDAMYLVFFDWDKADIGAGGQNVVDAVAEEIKSRNLKGVHIVGHTDSSGPEAYNDKLAMRRANAVRDALAQRGVEAGIITLDGRGEHELLVKTADNVREPANRRAQITFK